MADKIPQKNQEAASGYLHPEYANSLGEFGMPRLLPRSQGWILEREVRDTPFRDAMGCYPLLVCRYWDELPADLDQIKDGLVCLSAVTDPFGDYDEASLRQCFPDVMIPFKEHFVVDLSSSLDTFVHPHHRRNARKALHEIAVNECPNPIDFLEDWMGLYGTLIQRHKIKGIAAFSRESFSRQLKVPGIVVFRAVHDNQTAGMLLWYAQGNRAYYHLGAFHQVGYNLGASFALFNYSLDYFGRHGFDWLDLGAGAGTEPGAESGLTRFKQGWSTGVRMAYFCGRIFDRRKYDEIVRAKNVSQTNYFPAYRVGEFG